MPAQPWIEAYRASHDTFVALLTGLDPEQAAGPSAATEWTIGQVASHLGSQAEIAQSWLAAGVPGGQPADPSRIPAIWARWDGWSPEQQVDEAVASDTRFLERLDGIGDADRAGFTLDLFGQTFDLAAFVAMRLNEHVLHTWDIAAGLDPAATIDAGQAEPLLDAMVPMVGRLGRPVEHTPLIVQTSDPDGVWRLSLQPTAHLERIGTDQGLADLVLPSETFLRMLVGRLRGADVDRVRGDAELLEQVRSAFPGY